MMFQKNLEEWYSLNKRDLPWRKTKNPYHVWLSEIILHQTRVKYGIKYYNKFIQSYPTIEDLANAKQDDILKLWQGLGYYQRAMNMHDTAKTLVKVYKGKFPESYNDLLKLKGIGEYTAAAIASFSFNIPVPVVDGNVLRVLSRYFGVYKPVNSTEGKSIINDLAKKVFNTDRPDIHNHAIMEFGAVQCVPKNPNCNICIFKNECVAFLNNLTGFFPVKNQTAKMKNRYFYYFLIFHNDYLYVRKRESKDIWMGLYDFPLIESNKNLSKEKLFSSSEFNSLIGGKSKILSFSKQYKHQLSHQTIYATFIKVNTDLRTVNNSEKYCKIRISELDTLAVPRLIERYLLKEDLLR